jgi:hypothetical protein
MGNVNNSVKGTVHGNITQVGGNIREGHPPEVLDALAELHAALASLGHAGPARRTAENQLDIIERELHKPQPDRAEMSQRLARFSEVITNAGGLLASGVSVAGAVGILTRWVGL